MSTSTDAAPQAGSTLSDGALALHLAEAAGSALLEVRDREMSAGTDPRAIKDLGDRAAQEVLARLLAEHRPGDAVLSEEAADDPRRLRAERVWIIDPLDGTREFSEAGRVDWAVHVALWERGDLTTGAVTLPAAGLAYTTADPATVPPSGDGPLRLAVSRTRPPALVDALVESLGAVLVPMGSAGVKATALFRDEVDAYVHAGGQYEWDSAAPVAVARAAGLHTSRIDGTPLVYNQADPRLPDLVLCRPEHAHRLLTAIASAPTTAGARS